MKIFALDTSSSVLALGMMEDDQIRGELMQNKALTHSEHLMPHIDYLLSSLEENVREMDLFATTIGPGSFTGIRIGVATANAFALASGKKVVGISTLEALAYNFEHSDAIIITTMYAQREDYYRGIYRFEDGELVVIEEEAAVAKDDILQEASLFADAEVIIAGELADALRLDHWSQLQNQNDDTVFLQNEKASNNDSFEKSIADIKNFSRKFKIVTDYGIIQIANAVDNHIRGGVLCHIARKRFSQAMDVVTPVYIRKPQAEVQYEENQRKNEESHG